MKKENNPIILCLFGILPVVWLGLLIAPTAHGGLPEIIARFPAAMNDPFHIELCGDSLKTVIVLLCAYGLTVGVILSSPQLPSGRGTRFGQVGLCPNRQPKIPGSRTRGQQDLHAECPYGSGRTKTPPQPQHGRCRRQRRRQNEVLRQTEFVSSNTSFTVLDPKASCCAARGICCG